MALIRQRPLGQHGQRTRTRGVLRRLAAVRHDPAVRLRTSYIVGLVGTAGFVVGGQALELRLHKQHVELTTELNSAVGEAALARDAAEVARALRVAAEAGDEPGITLEARHLASILKAVEEAGAAHGGALTQAPQLARLRRELASLAVAGERPGDPWRAAEAAGKIAALAASHQATADARVQGVGAAIRESARNGEVVETTLLAGLVLLLVAEGVFVLEPAAAWIIRRQVSDLRRAKAAAEAAAEAKTRFLANMSHEIRTPLTAILGFAELLDDPASDGATRAGAAGSIRRSGEHLLAIVNDILDISRIDAGAMTIRMEDFCPRELLTEVGRLGESLAQGKPVGVRTEVHPETPNLVRGDLLRVRQVLLNLASNAVKFTDEGSVVLRLAPEAEGVVRVEVADTGIGMSPEQQAQLFTPFVQFDDSARRRQGGTGLGLAIAKRLADRMNGTLEVTSSPGSGSTFVFRFPAEHPAGEAGRDAAAAALAAGLSAPVSAAAARSSPVSPAVPPPGEPNLSLAGVRVLLVDDSLDNRVLVRFFLRAAGATVLEACDGAEAVELLQRDPEAADLVLMDMQMPVLDGYGATRRLREQGRTLPILALTAHVLEGERERCLEAGCDGYLTKPVDRRALIEACAARSRPRKAAA